MQNLILNSLLEAQKVLEAFIANAENIQKISDSGELMFRAIKNGNKIFACGNGGSMCDAMHFAEELSGRFRGDRAALPALAISDASHITCVANDYGFDSVFSRYIEGLGKEGDILLAISTSGNSKNIINAAEASIKKGMKVIALTGKDGGRLGAMADVEIRAPQSQFSDRVQEIHIKVIHTIIHYIEERNK